MDLTKSFTIFALAATSALAQQTGLAVDKEAARLLKASEAEQTSYINAEFDRGLPQASVNAVTILVRAHSATLAPVLGARVLQTLKSATPQELFTDKKVEPAAVIMAAASAIAYAADENALKELSKFLAVDERKFSWLIGFAMSDGGSRNFFPVAYKAYEFGNPLLNAKMTAWIEKQIGAEADAAEPQVKTWWAETLVLRVGHVPSATDWANDPIVKAMDPELAKGIREQVIKLAADDATKRTEHTPGS